MMNSSQGPDDTRISALRPDARTLDAASGSATSAGIALDEPDDTGSQARGPHPPTACAKRQKYCAKALTEPATKSDHGTDGLGSHVRQVEYLRDSCRRLEHVPARRSPLSERLSKIVVT
jgi:hypothetical protein